MTDTTDNNTDSPSSKSKRQYHSQQWWAEHYQAWQVSGLSKKQYCVNHGITPSSFFNWVSKFEKAPAPQGGAPTSVPFIRADVTPKIKSSQAISLAVGDVRVYFDSGAPASDINHWIAALRSSQC